MLAYVAKEDEYDSKLALVGKDWMGFAQDAVKLKKKLYVSSSDSHILCHRLKYTLVAIIKATKQSIRRRRGTSHSRSKLARMKAIAAL